MQHVNSKKAKIILEVLADTLRLEREKQNKSQRILADEYEIQKSLISRIENGKNEPKIISLWTICNALEIDISELFKKVESRLPSNFSLMDK